MSATVLVALQTSARLVRRRQDLHASWAALVPLCWLDTRIGCPSLEVAVTLQAWYFDWLLPFEQHLLRTHAAAVVSFDVPALLLRRLAEQQEDDVDVRCLVTQLSLSAATQHAGTHVRGSQVRVTHRGGFIGGFIALQRKRSLRAESAAHTLPGHAAAESECLYIR